VVGSCVTAVTRRAGDARHRVVHKHFKQTNNTPLDLFLCSSTS